MPRSFSNLMALLRDNGQTFREEMADVDADLISSITGKRTKVENPKTPFAEHYFTMVGQRACRHEIVCDTIQHASQDNPSLVEFNWEECWNRHLNEGDVIGWFHTHPPGAHYMSATDMKTFHSWLVSLGGPRYAVILCDGKVHCWKLFLDEAYQLQWEEREAEILSTGQIIIQDEE